MPSVVAAPLTSAKLLLPWPLLAAERFIPFQPATLKGLLLVLNDTCTRLPLRPLTVILNVSLVLPPKTSDAVTITFLKVPRLALLGFRVSDAVPLPLSASVPKAG